MALSDFILQKPVIKTERLCLRPLSICDVDAMLEYTTNKDIYKYWGKGAGKADKDPSLLFAKEKSPTKSFHLGISKAADNKVIGEIWVYLIENDRMAKIAIRLSPLEQGHGYACEALMEMTRFCFKHTELQRIWTDVDVRNIASCKMLQRCGYTKEGTIRQGKMVSTWCDYHIYGILKEDLMQ